jgi:Holliday junction resolvasome RuvABC DNA-binding subunit
LRKADTPSSEGEAYEALLALGYTMQEAARALTEVRRNVPEDTASEILVRQALRVLMSGGR